MATLDPARLPIALLRRTAWAVRRATAHYRALPDFLIIGAQKAGTTSLFRYLSEHPRICAPATKEVHYFDVHYQRGLGWYRSQFPLRPRSSPTGIALHRQLTFEASPSYLLYPMTPSRIRDLMPATRLIVLLRDPIERAWSHYKDNVSRGTEPLPFLAALEAEEDRLRDDHDRIRRGLEPGRSFRNFSYVERSLYASQLRRWFGCFPESQFLVLDSELLFENTAEAFARVVQFVGLELPARLPSWTAHNARPKAELDQSARAYLTAKFLAPNEELAQAHGYSFLTGHERATARDPGVSVRILHLATHPMTVRILMRGQLEALHCAGFEVGVAAGPGVSLDVPGVSVFPIRSLRRDYAPARDLAALFEIGRLIRRFRPCIVNAGTPKAGLLGLLAAWLMRVPIRIYLVRGLRLETASGPARQLLMLTEKLAARLAHLVVAVSPSLRKRCLELGIGREEKVVVLGAGSSNGVDVARFSPARLRSRDVEVLRSSLGIPEKAQVVGFVGRLTKDKGIADLYESFMDTLERGHPEARLLMVGDFEEGDAVTPHTVERLRGDSRVTIAGFVSDVAPYYGLMTVLVLPSYREGFPNAPLEAAACGLPVVGYRVSGTVDAVDDGTTGTLVEAGDIRALTAAIHRYLADPALAARHGAAGRLRVEERFSQELVWENLVREYRRLASERLSSSPPLSPRD